MNKPDFYDNWKFQQIFQIASYDIYEAINRFEQYFEKHPKDYTQYPYYISHLLTVGELDLAKEKIDFITQKVYDDKCFLKNEFKLSQFKKNILFVKVKLLAILEKYDEVLKLLEPYPEIFQPLGLVGIYFYSQIKTNTLIKERDSIPTYLFKQIVEYNENDFLKHIQKHLPNYNMNLDTPNNNIFSTDFPLEKVLAEIKKYIPSSQNSYYGFYDTKYYFKYDNCGRDNNKVTDYFVVSCFINSSNIITMCPTSTYQINNYIDLNYLKNDDNLPKTKRLSQIDKFNQKYNK